ncbi:hypothetical protein D3C71_642890 [compost metagenome]
MAITALPNPPSRSDPANFPERADAFMAALPRFATEANTLQAQVNEAASAAGDGASAAASSRDAAAGSRNQAAQFADVAADAQQGAAQKAAQSADSATLAQSWANRTGAPVAGGEFSAKHYAQLAAQGMGLPIFGPDNVPTTNKGAIYISGQGIAEWDVAQGAYRVKSDIPLAAVLWSPLRAAIAAGLLPGDGQTVSRTTFPDLAQAVIDGRVPVVSEADWLADPLKRAGYTLGDGSTTIRVPDYNGKSAGALGAVFLRGDGALSAETNGLIQRDALQGHTFESGGAKLGVFGINSNGLNPGGLQIAAFRADNIGAAGIGSNGANGTPRVASETRPLGATGCFVVKAFGAVVNPGSVDAAQLASDYAALNAAFQALSDSVGFTIIYPNGGTAAAPASVVANSRYVSPNPFPGFHVLCLAELQIGGAWGNSGWFSRYWTNSNDAYGTAAGQYDGNQIIVQTGFGGICGSPANLTGSVFPDAAGVVTAPCRVKVWKLKGDV